MSYASVTKENIPAGEMAEPDQGLRDGSFTEAPDSDKINVVPPPGTNPDTWEKEKAELKKEFNEASAKAKKAGKDFGDKAKKEYEEAESAFVAGWNKSKEVILRPSTLGGLVGVVNVGLLGGLGYIAYQNRDRPWDQRWVAGSIAGLIGLFTAEGYVADSYLQTPEGQAEAQRAKEEGSRLYLQAKEVILRPGVAGGLAGVLNVAVLGTVGFFAHKHWNERWDNKVVAGVAAGLLALSGVEGMLAVEYDDKVLHNKKK